ncbi:MAG: hypothetical protein J3Q66DRAFT_435965 [Benniella sp.]|nr:MAG: hypothetical protein J3Q66DRAFT_435965 [Benniella sp.]
MVSIANNKTVVLLQRPTGHAVAGVHVGVKHKELDTSLNEGDILVRNIYVSVDPYLRGRMEVVEGQPVQPFEIDHPFDSFGISEVIESRNSKFPVGTLVTSPFIKWEERSVVPVNATSILTVLPPEVRDSTIPLSAYISVLGMHGFTAYGSLIDIGELKVGETIFISAAAGAIGQLVGQIAKLKGLRVIGSTSSDAKAEFLRQELKFDVAINYKKGSLVESLRAAAPEGVDIYYDNVGGDLLDAALEVIKPHGRILACGMVSGYNTKEGYAYKNLFRIVTKRLTIKGFLVQEFDPALQERFAKDVRTWLLNGDIRYKEDITEGLEAAPEAFVGIFEGKNVGKAVVKIADL